MVHTLFIFLDASIYFFVIFLQSLIVDRSFLWRIFILIFSSILHLLFDSVDNELVLFLNVVKSKLDVFELNPLENFVGDADHVGISNFFTHFVESSHNYFGWVFDLN